MDQTTVRTNCIGEALDHSFRLARGLQCYTHLHWGNRGGALPLHADRLLQRSRPLPYASIPLKVRRVARDNIREVGIQSNSLRPSPHSRGIGPPSINLRRAIAVEADEIARPSRAKHTHT